MGYSPDLSKDIIKLNQINKIDFTVIHAKVNVLEVDRVEYFIYTFHDNMLAATV